MVVTLDPKLEAALTAQANHQGIAPEKLALQLLRERLIATAPPEPRDAWERELVGAARTWGWCSGTALLPTLSTSRSLKPS